jgi:hypothetical protein
MRCRRFEVATWSRPTKLGTSVLLIALCSFSALTTCSSKPSSSSGSSEKAEYAPLSGSDQPAGNIYQEPRATISPEIARDFSTDEITDIGVFERAYGFTLSAQEKAFLAKNKFLLKPLIETSIRPDSSDDAPREFLRLYDAVKGDRDYKRRTAANAEFYSADLFFNTYNNLFVEILKEMENKAFFPSMKSISKALFEAAAKKRAAAASDEDKTTWTEVRNYFAIPYAIFSTTINPLTNEDYVKNGQIQDPGPIEAAFREKERSVDTVEKASAFVKSLGLDADSQQKLLEDIGRIYAAKEAGIPAILRDEFEDYSKRAKTRFAIDFTQFTPRGTYTTSSLRRQYFRGMNWYINVPFFLKSPQLTKNAFAIARLLAEREDDLKQYNRMESTIGFLIGRSDDLQPADYVKALDAAKGAKDPDAAALEFLAQAKSPMIKNLAAFYDAAGTHESDDVRLLTKGLRFFSGKFVIDSYWMGELTQGDEKPKADYPGKLPPLASSLEIMALLGSDKARSQIPTLDFYEGAAGKAIDKAMRDVEKRNAALDGAFWQSTIYNGWLWTIQGLFGWEKDHARELPAFMQSPLWSVKSLMTGSGFWTELRHATILYAKPQFAEKGEGGENACGPLPPPAKPYFEPQLAAYRRLLWLAESLSDGIHNGSFDIRNESQLKSFISAMRTVVDRTEKQLANTRIAEQTETRSVPDPDHPDKKCVDQVLKDDRSEWEDLRLTFLDALEQAAPTPAEGQILPAKDRRVAVVADVQTGGDSQHPTRVLFEGVGIPYVIIVAVKDTNGPRFTIGFTYSHYEMTQPYGGRRMTDEDWQQKFYKGDDPDAAFDYADRRQWPDPNTWYQPIVKLR